MKGRELEREESLEGMNYELGMTLGVQLEPLVAERGGIWAKVEAGEYPSLDIKGQMPAGQDIAYAALEHVEKVKKTGFFWRRVVEKETFVSFRMGIIEGALREADLMNGLSHLDGRLMGNYRALFRQSALGLQYVGLEKFTYDEKAHNGRRWRKVGPMRAYLILGAAIDAVERLIDNIGA